MKHALLDLLVSTSIHRKKEGIAFMLAEWVRSCGPVKIATALSPRLGDASSQLRQVNHLHWKERRPSLERQLLRGFEPNTLTKYPGQEISALTAAELTEIV